MKKRLLLVFLITFSIGVLLLIRFQAAPFGSRSLICLDLYDQYLPMYLQQTSLSNLSGLFHSWNGVLGYNNWAQSAYYCNSIFLSLYWLFPDSMVAELTDILTILKIALSSVTCLVWLEYRLKKHSPLLLGGAAAYALCGYSTAFMSQIMWTDQLFLVPLVLLALERMMREKKGCLYSLLLAVSLITNFYIGFTVCLFLVLYFLLVSLPSRPSSSTKTESFLRFFVYSLLGGALGAFVLLPTALALNKTVSSSSSIPVYHVWYSRAVEYLKMMLPAQTAKMAFNGVNIFTGTMIFLLVPLFFLNKKIRPIQRICGGIFLLLLWLSLNNSLLDYIWHGFRYPHMLPGRWTFLFSLFLVELGCHALMEPEGLSPLRSLLGISIGTALVAAASVLTDLGDPVPTVYYVLFSAAALLLLAGLGVFPLKFSLPLRRKLLILFVILQITDCGLCFIQVVCENRADNIYYDQRFYSDSIAIIKEVAQKWASGSEEFYRLEANSGFTDNSSMIGDYKGIYCFSSTMSASIYRLMMYLGYPYYTENRSVIYQPNSRVLSSLLGVRYILDFDHNLSSLSPGWSQTDTASFYEVWENPTVLPLAYRVEDMFENLEITDDDAGLRHQNDFVRSMTGIDAEIYTELTPSKRSADNALLEQDSQTGIFSRMDPGNDMLFSYEYIVEEEKPVFLANYFHSGEILVSWDMGEASYKTIYCTTPYLGIFPKGTTLEVSVRVSDLSRGQFGVRLYYYNEEVWQSAYTQLISSSLNVEKADYTMIQGTISMEKEGLVCASIAQDGGWDVYIDGKKTDTSLLADALLGFRVPEGVHTITLRYHVPGLTLGVLISLLAGLVLIFLRRSFPLRI